MNQLRKHLKFTLVNYIRLFYLQLMGLQIEPTVYVGRNVYIGRYLNKISVASNVVLKDGCHLCACNSGSKIVIGKNTTIGFNTLIYASESITIGPNCLIAPFVYFVDSNHGVLRNKLINEQSNVTRPIEISSDVWIGAGAVILGGVKIGVGAVIGANSVVSCDVPEYEIWAGIPARKIKERI